MVPTSLVNTEMLTLLGTDTTMLAGALFLFPIQSDFAPGPDPGLTDADLGTFDGSSPKTTGAATRPVITDPVTGNQYLRIPDPAGGWVFTTTGTTNLPQNMTGVALSSDSTTIEGGTLLATALLPQGTIEFSATGQSVDTGGITFTLVLPALA